ncbi:uncharacterized protein LOC107037351 [Diachasma alloeum]|uniref:uncharacterized protein LOC107037351 n=1 Tax=Diachasma alloeum TaxID=454923 RepID=UPI000738115A|nr:uncharacterized protein LOC107037351 [Diachasma alloeum]
MILPTWTEARRAWATTRVRASGQRKSLLKSILWFAELEEQFHLSGINDKVTRYYYASSHLDPKAAAEVQDILLNVPAETPYTRLKEALVERFTLSRDARLQQLLDREVLGDRKPSQFLRHLRSLDGMVSDNILRTKWLSRLPMTTQSILASQADMALDRLATLADKLHEIALPVAHINDVQEPTSSALETPFSRLEAICEPASALKGQSVVRSRSRSRSRSRTTLPAPDNNQCWYHRRYHDRTRRCKAPCSWQGNAPTDR